MKKRILSLGLSVSLIFSCCLSLVSLSACNLFGSRSYKEGFLTFGKTKDGAGYYVLKCDKDATGDIVIPSVFRGKPVLRIGEYADEYETDAFGYLENVRSVTIPARVTSILGNAFLGTNLEKIIVEQGNPMYRVEGNCLIWMRTYYGEPQPEIIAGFANSVIPEGVYSVEMTAFRHQNIRELIIPMSMRRIENGAFSECNELSTVTVLSENLLIVDEVNPFVSPSLKRIVVPVSNSQFKVEGDCLIEKDNNKLITGVASSIIPDYITIIGAYSFSKIDIKSVFVPINVVSIESAAFLNCVNLESAVLPEGLDSLGWGVFANCTSIKSINIPNSITTMQKKVFEGWLNSQKINIKGHIQKPSGWDTNWNGGNAQINWGV